MGYLIVLNITLRVSVKAFIVLLCRYYSVLESKWQKSCLLSFGPYHFYLLLSPSLHEIFPGISNFLEENSSLSHFIVFLYFFALITEEGFLISPCYSLELCIQMGISLLLYFAFIFSSFFSYL